MIRRIVLENFMSHSRTEIEPAQGLTVLIGPNNCGKSAVVSALQTLCSNITGDFMVRHGEKECRVTIETEDGHSVTWRRHRGAVSYIIDGREVPRGVTPDDLHEVLRLPKVVSEDGNDKFDIHFGSQKSPIFLLDDTERRAAMFFASSSDAEYLMRMQKRHQEKVREAKRDGIKLGERLTKLDAELACLEPVAELSEAMQSLVEEHTAVMQRSELCQRIARDFEQLARQTEIVSRLTAELVCLTPLETPPPLVEVEPLYALVEQLAHVERQRQKEFSRSDALSDLRWPPELTSTEPIELTLSRLAEAEQRQRIEHQRAVATSRLTAPPVLAETEPLDETISRLSNAERLHRIEQQRASATADLAMPPDLEDTDKVQELCRSVSNVTRQYVQASDEVEALLPLRPAPQLVDAQPLEATISELSSAVEAFDRASCGHELLSVLATPPVLDDAQSLGTLITSCEQTKAEVVGCEAEIARLQHEMAAVLDAVRAWTDANPVCPTCGAEVDAERLMSWGHAHG